MKSKSILFALSLLGLSLTCSLVCDAAFEPAWVAGKGFGVSSVVLPGETNVVQIQGGKAYPYGTVVMNNPDTTLLMILSLANELTLQGDGILRTADDPQDKARKIVTLERGKLDVTLHPDYSAQNTLDVAGSCIRTSITKGGKASFETATEGELTVFIITCGDADISVSGPQFKILKLDKDDVMSAACAADMSYIRVKDVRGAFDIGIRGAEEGSDETVAMEPGSVIKILQKQSEIEKTVVVTILVVGTDDSVQKAITYTVKSDAIPAVSAPPAAPPASALAMAPGDGGKKPAPTKKPAKTAKEPKVGGAVTDGDWDPMWPSVWLSTTATTTTTTTTIPNRDLAALRAYRARMIPSAPLTTTTTTTTSTTTTTRPHVTPVGRH